MTQHKTLIANLVHAQPSPSFLRLTNHYWNISLTLNDATRQLASPSCRSVDSVPEPAASSQVTFPTVYVAARHITFVHLPPAIDVFETVDLHVSFTYLLCFYSLPSIHARRNCQTPIPHYDMGADRCLSDFIKICAGEQATDVTVREHWRKASPS